MDKHICFVGGYSVSQSKFLVSVDMLFSELYPVFKEENLKWASMYGLGVQCFTILV